MHNESIYLYLLLLLGAATALSTLFHRLKITPLLAFIVTGALLGPTGLGIITDAGELESFAHLGLSFLLFLLGLEFSLPRLIALRRTVFGLGLVQVLICTLVFAVAFYWWGLPLSTSLLIAAGLSLSSTAIVSRELSRLGQLNTRHGEIAIGILLFQDLVAVALLVAVPLVAGQGDEIQPIDLMLGFFKTLGLLLVFFLVAQWLLPRILREVAMHKSDELLVLTALVIILLCGILTSTLGLSMELGAFIAGMLLGESRFRHQLEADIRPFRDLLLGLFFITVGMLVDLDLLREYWVRILACGIALLLFKSVIISVLARLMGESWRAALPAGLALSQGGEFLFAMLALANPLELVPNDVTAFLISMVIVSMVLTPLIILHGPSLVDSALLRITHAALRDKTDPQQISSQHKRNHVVVLGFGRVGQSVARFLRLRGIDYLVLDSDAVRVAESATGGEPVYYGITTRLDILKAAGVADASRVIISFDVFALTRRILKLLRELNPEVPVLVRARDEKNLEELLSLGATEVIPETHEASLTLASHALLMLSEAPESVHDLIDEARRGRYQMLQSFFHGERMNNTLSKNKTGSALHAVVLTGSAWACNKAMDDLRLPPGMSVTELHRQQQILLGEQLDAVRFRHGDVLILQGPLELMKQAEGCLLRG